MKTVVIDCEDTRCRADQRVGQPFTCLRCRRPRHLQARSLFPPQTAVKPLFHLLGVGLIATRELKRGSKPFLTRSSRSMYRCAMPRGARIAPGEIVSGSHSRERNELFHKPEDYSAFERIMIWPLDAPADWIGWCMEHKPQANS